MRKVKYRFMLNYEKEERWINEMSEQGWHLEKITLGRFVFEKGEPNKYIYRNEFLIDKKKGDKKEYYNLLEDSGIEIVYEFSGWIYMRKLASEGPFELFSDHQSYIAYYKRLLGYILPLFLVNLFMAVLNLFMSNIDGSLGWLNITIGSINSIVSIILLLPIYFIFRSKVRLEKKQQFFE